MNFLKQHRFKAIALSVLFAIVLGGGFFLPQQFPGDGAAQASSEASITGFLPNTAISYRIYGSDGQTHEGEIVADESGMARLPSYEYQNIPPSLLTYDLSVSGEKALDVLLVLDKQSGQARIDTKGLSAFSDVTLETPLGTTQSKADWAGIFKNTEDFGEQGASGTIKLAFFEGGIQRDVPAQSPYVIEIVSSPGGGGPTSAGVNQFSPTTCPYGADCNGSLAGHINTFVNNYVVALQRMSAQFSAVMMDYAFIVGTFFDAKSHLQTQQTYQILQAEAHKDYHPSETMCQFGSFVKTVARTEEKARFDKAALGQIMMTRYTAQENSPTADGLKFDSDARLRQFREVYCDPADNANGLEFMCQHDPENPDIQSGEDVGGSDKERFNKDIDFVRTAYSPLTMNINFTDTEITEDETDFLAMSRHLYWPGALSIANSDALIDLFPDYQNARSLIAKTSVAHNSFLELAALKASSETGNQEASGWNFMKAMLKDFGLEDEEIHAYLGDYPSYYAQMEVLTKKIYQNPDFYTNLYDKPANIERISVALDAFKLMQQRDMFDSHLRRELLTSLVLERAIAEHAEGVAARLEAATADMRFQ